MALALANSLRACSDHDACDQLDRYVRWWQHGQTSCIGRCFDIRNMVRGALRLYQETGEPNAGPTHRQTAGNESILRLAPVVLAYAPHHEATLNNAAASSHATHGAPEAVDTCRLLAEILLRALDGADRDAVLAPLDGPRASPELAASPRASTKPRLRIISEAAATSSPIWKRRSSLSGQPRRLRRPC